MYIVSTITIVLIIISPNTQSLNINHNPSIYLQLKEESQIKLGKGNNPNDIPIIECTNSTKNSGLNCTISIRSKKDGCKFILSSDKYTTSVNVDYLYQFDNGKVIVVWHQKSSISDVKKFARKITIFVVNANCTNKDTLTLPKNTMENYWHDLQAVVLYEDSFDVVITLESTLNNEKTCLSYNLNGHEIDTSTKQVKDVLTFFDIEQKVTNTESNDYKTICGRDDDNNNNTKKFVCVQQMSKRELLHRREFHLPENTRIIAVRHFKNGGMMLFGLETDLKLIVAEMRFRRRLKVRSVNLKWPVNRDKSAVIDFREERNDIHFTLIAETSAFDHSVILQFFRLVDKSLPKHRRRS